MISLSNGPVQAGNMIKMAGQRGVAVLYITADVADTQTVTIGSDVYEYDRTANGVTAGRIALVGHSDDTASEATDVLIAAINASGTEPVTAYDGGDNEVIIASNLVDDVSIALSETLAGAGNIWSAATMYGGGRPSIEMMSLSVRVPVAAEVTLGTLRVALNFAPTHVDVNVRVTSTMLTKAWDGGVTLDQTNNLVTLNNAGTTDWAATDTISILCMG